MDMKAIRIHLHPKQRREEETRDAKLHSKAVQWSHIVLAPSYPARGGLALMRQVRTETAGPWVTSGNTSLGEGQETTFLFFSFVFFFFFDWSIVDLQHCVNFCCAC